MINLNSKKHQKEAAIARGFNPCVTTPLIRLHCRSCQGLCQCCATGKTLVDSKFLHARKLWCHLSLLSGCVGVTLRRKSTNIVPEQGHKQPFWISAREVPCPYFDDRIREVR